MRKNVINETGFHPGVIRQKALSTQWSQCHSQSQAVNIVLVTDV